MGGLIWGLSMQEEGWPLGLRLSNARIGLLRNGEFSGSISFSTLLTDSPTHYSIDSSSDLDTQVGILFQHKSFITKYVSLLGLLCFYAFSMHFSRHPFAFVDITTCDQVFWVFSMFERTFKLPKVCVCLDIKPLQSKNQIMMNNPRS